MRRRAMLEVDRIADLGNWQSVITRGRYEELADDLATAAMNLLASRLAPITVSETAGPSGLDAIAPACSVAFRIRLAERTGRYEKS